MTPVFITREVLEDIHTVAIEKFGGSPGVHDEGLIDSALASALNDYCYGGDLYDVAAAYAFHISQNQGFRDGDKRTGVAAALTFLVKNGCKEPEDDGRILDAMIAIAKKRMGKPELAELFRELAR